MIPQKTILYFLLVAGILTTLGCAKKTLSGTSSYSENLKTVRPRYTYVEPTIEKAKAPEKPAPTRYRPTKADEPLYITKRLEAILDTISQSNKSIRYINGFRVQLYVGNIRQEADAAKSFVYQLFPEIMPYISYSQPTYRVKVGDFMYRTDAEEFLSNVRQQYPAAVILPDRVEIKRGLEIRASLGNPKY